jgi:glutathione synthase/RimK-type ligase-like ATP-grasp enzyme
MGKINLLEIASTHFTIPDTLASFRLGGVNAFPNKPIVAKSFSSGLTTTNKSLMTTEVDKTKLHPEFPWFIQEKITSDADITTFICGDNLFTYERDRKNLKGLDWRSEQSISPHVREWKKINLTEDQREKIFSFCLAIGVDWGRIDFMRSNSGELIFLEYNANGQWVFLDFQNEDGLLDCVARYIFPQ